MDYRALKSFVDKGDRHWYRVGDAYLGKRAEELIKLGYVQAANSVEIDGEVIDLSSLKNAELMDHLDKLGVRSHYGMRKDELIKAIMDAVEGK